jgi:hypothetical protein
VELRAARRAALAAPGLPGAAATDDTKAEDLFGVALPAAVRAWPLEVTAASGDDLCVAENPGSPNCFGGGSRTRTPKDVGAGAPTETVELDDAHAALEVELLDDADRVSSLAHGAAK